MSDDSRHRRPPEEPDQEEPGPWSGREDITQRSIAIAELREEARRLKERLGDTQTSMQVIDARQGKTLLYTAGAVVALLVGLGTLFAYYKNVSAYALRNDFAGKVEFIQLQTEVAGLKKTLPEETVKQLVQALDEREQTKPPRGRR